MSDYVYVPPYYRRRPTPREGGTVTMPAGAPPPEAAAPAPAPGGGGFFSQRTGPLPNWAWIGIAAGLAIAVWIWRSHSGSQATTTSSTAAAPAATAAAGSDQCSDTNGNPVPCAQADYASQIASLQAEIENMQGAQSNAVGQNTPTTTQTTVPNVVGDSTAGAGAKLLQAGLLSTVQGSGQTVQSQSPTAGTTVSIGTTVTLTTAAATATATAAQTASSNSTGGG